MLENILIFIIVSSAAAYIARRFLKAFKNSEKNAGCGCGSDCSACHTVVNNIKESEQD